MNADETRLDRIAGNIADGEVVDWDAEGDPDLSQSNRGLNLRVLERIRDLHQSGPAVPKTWGHLEIVDRIGGGGYGEVYRAWDPSLRTHVALKLLHAERPGTEPAVLLQEARNLAKVRHPNVVTVHGVAEHDGRVGIWTELIQGQTLEQRLTEQGALRAEEAALVGLDLVRALGAVHGAGLVHRDVKASNVMREAGGRIVLADFGTVAEVAQAGAAPTDTFVGTAHYMAPEVFRGVSGGKGADIYALGVLLYRLVTARYPVEAKDIAEMRDKHERGAALPLREVRADLPATFVRIVERATAAAPADRYANVAEMERDLASFLGEPSSGVGARRSGGRSVIVAVLIVVAAALAWVSWSRRAGEVAPSLQCDLFRATAQAEERLAPGGVIRPGDHLFLEVESARPSWVYVLDEDDQGNAYVLFPLAGVDEQNPLRAGERTRLPGTRGGVPITWDVDQAGGHESVYVVAATHPLEALDRELKDLPRAGAPHPVSVIDLQRGIGSIGQMPRPPGGGAPTLSDVFARLSGEAGAQRGLWTWSIRLANPTP